MIPIIERMARILTMVPSIEAWGSRGREKRRNPYVPIFSNTLARITEPAVGASTCASGSQVWKGNMGTLIANPMKNPKNRTTAAVVPQTWGLGGAGGAG